MLTDIEGSTALWERDSKGMDVALTRHDELIATFVEAGGGVLVKQKGEGDAMLAVFRRATEAVSTARELQSALEQEEWPSGLSISVRIALHTGEAFERDNDFYGPTVNRAARLRALAQGGQVLLSQATTELVRDALPATLQLSDLGTFELKGLARQERVFELLSRVEPESREATEVESASMPSALDFAGGQAFVGRASELARVEAKWQEAVGGAFGIVLLAGEPGIGKTRLAAEVAASARGEGATVLYGRCDENLGGPYQPFAEALRDLVDSLPNRELNLAMGTKLADLARLLPDLAERFPLSVKRSGDPEEERDQLFDAVVHLLGHAAARHPLLIVLDDLHWAAGSTLLLLRHLARHAGFAGLILGTYRDTEIDRQHPLAETLADLRRDSTVMERVPIRGLDVESVATYVAETADQSLDEQEAELVRMLHEETNGNPFFLGEVLRHLVEGGVIFREDGRWQTRLVPGEEDLPEGVRDVITRRLSRLSEDANRVLAIASVVGPNFSMRVLEPVFAEGRDSDAMIDALEEAARAGLIAEASGGSFTFSHALVRQTLYSELSSARRMRLHRRVGEAIETLAESHETRTALAHHFAEAALDGGIAKAADYALAAGKEAIEHLAHEEAVAHLKRGIEVLELDSPPDRTRRVELLIALASAHRELGDRESAGEAALLAAEDARAIGSAENLALAARAYPGIGGMYKPDPIVRSLCEEALEALGDGGPALRATLLARLAQYEAFAEHSGPTGLLVAKQALELARETGEPEPMIAALSSCVSCMVGHPDVPARLALIGELLPLAESAGDDRSLLLGMAFRLDALVEIGDRAGYDKATDELHRVADELNSRFAHTLLVDKAAAFALLEGRFDDALRLADEALANASSHYEAVFLHASRKAWILREQGRYEEGVQATEPLLENPSSRVLGLSAVALFQADQGHPEAVSRFLEELGADVLDLLPHDPVRVYWLALYSEAIAAAGDKAVAERAYEEIEPHSGTMIVAARAGGGAAFDTHLGILKYVMGDVDAADSLFRSGHELETSMGARASVARNRYWHAQALLTRDEPGDRDEAEALIRESISAAEELGMAGLASQARALADR